MTDLMKLKKPELVEIVKCSNINNATLGAKVVLLEDQILLDDTKRRGLEYQIKKIEQALEGTINKKENEIVNLKQQLEAEKYRFYEVNTVIDTVAAMKFPTLCIQSEPSPDGILDEQFFLLRHLKRLVSPNNLTNFFRG